jgi:hypothetical protein
MPLDGAVAKTISQTERDAAAHFAQLLRDHLTNMPETNCVMLLVVSLSADLRGASARLIPERRFSELPRDAACNQEYAGGLEQGLHDEAEPVIA